jgi:predicted enzyme related to lactoylglutathione lyase
MFTVITHSSVYVLDQDEAVDFYVGKLGLEITADVDLGFMRWLTVSVPGQPGREILLTAAQVRDLLTKGALGLGFILSTEDCRKTYETLKARGVDLTQEPIEQPYGIDCAIRDPFGNHIRISQPAAEMGDITDEVRKRWSDGAPADR